MVNETIIIGGPGGAGKTTLSRAIGRSLDRKSLTLDDLVIAARAITTPDTHPPLHSGRDGHLRYFTETPPQQLIANASELALTVWQMAERVIRHHRASKTPLVMDHWLFEPELIAALDPAAAVLWLHIDPAALERRERATDFTVGSTDPEAMHRNFMARSLWRNEYLAAEAEEYGQPVLRLTGKELPGDVLSAALSLLA